MIILTRTISLTLYFIIYISCSSTISIQQPIPAKSASYIYSSNMQSHCMQMTVHIFHANCNLINLCYMSFGMVHGIIHSPCMHRELASYTHKIPATVLCWSNQPSSLLPMHNAIMLHVLLYFPVPISCFWASLVDSS